MAIAVVSALIASSVNGPMALAFADADAEVIPLYSLVTVNTVGVQSTEFSLEQRDASLNQELASNPDGDSFNPEPSRIQPRFAWGAVIKVLLSQPACEAARSFYNSQFPR